MATKPSVLPQWATDASAQVLEPTAAKKLAGWVVGERPTAHALNWMLNNLYLWTKYVDEFLTTANSFMAGQTFNGNNTFYGTNTFNEATRLYGNVTMTGGMTFTGKTTDAYGIDTIQADNFLDTTASPATSATADTIHLMGRSTLPVNNSGWTLYHPRITADGRCFLHVQIDNQNETAQAVRSIVYAAGYAIVYFTMAANNSIPTGIRWKLEAIA